jgi:hypothetical protein
MVELRQKIILPDPEGVIEFPVSLCVDRWYTGPYPTCVKVVGEISEDLIAYIEGFGWRWDKDLRRFYPTE